MLLEPMVKLQVVLALQPLVDWHIAHRSCFA